MRSKQIFTTVPIRVYDFLKRKAQDNHLKESDVFRYFLIKGIGEQEYKNLKHGISNESNLNN